VLIGGERVALSHHLVIQTLMSEVGVVQHRMMPTLRQKYFVLASFDDFALRQNDGAVGMFIGKELDGCALVLNEAKPQVKREVGFGGGE
jgi:hypothetical protein